MHLSIKLCGLLLYAFVTTASSQERDRLWHTTTPGPSTLSTSSDNPPPSITGVSPVEDVPVAAEPTGDSGQVVHQEVVAAAEPAAQEPSDARGIQTVEDVLTVAKTPEENKEETLIAVEEKKELPVAVEENKEPLVAVAEKKEKKDRKWISAPKEEVKEEKPVIIEELEAEILKEQKEEKKGRKWFSGSKEEKNVEISVPKQDKKEPELEIVPVSIDQTPNVSSEVNSGEVTSKNKKKKPRKWVSVPGMVVEDSEAPVVPPTEEDIATAIETLDIAKEAVAEKPLLSSESPEKEVDLYSINALDMELPANITELLIAAEEGIPLVQETIISKKTTVYVTISDSIDAEPLFVNLTGIRHYTGQERRMMAGCLDLSDLMLTGEDAKEVIQRMSKHQFHKLVLSGNNITEFPANTFSPVAFSVRELRLDGNPLASNDQGEASVLQRGGLFHLTELRELNLSGCGLQDMDYFTPWNSNHLEVVDLSNNKLTSVPSNLQFFHKLKKLFLDGNPITRVTELPFALLWNMQVLSLADCKIATIEDDPFRNMDKLKELSLEGNNLTQISHVRLPRSNSAVKMFLSGNPWHCACEMLNFIEHYNYAIRDIEYIRCASPRWLEGLRTAYLTKEILSLDSVDGDCTPQSPRVSNSPMALPAYSTSLRADRLQMLALIVFVMAALFMLCHVLWARKKDKFRFEDEHDDIHYIRVEKKPTFK